MYCKATFILSDEFLAQFDMLHLQLQLFLGKARTPHKSVIVEKVLSRVIEELTINRNVILPSLQTRQAARN